MCAEPTASTPNNKHVPLANHIPSEVSVSSDASLTLKGLYRSVSLIPLFFISSFHALFDYMLLDFIKGEVQSISDPKWPPAVRLCLRNYQLLRQTGCYLAV
jgi:hypothetical protein